MNLDPLTASTSTLLWIVVDGFLMLAVIIFCVRLAGLRSFAKMSSFDFAVTVACGSILASVVMTENISFVDGVVAVSSLLLAQVAIALGRLYFSPFKDMVDNSPLLLMDGPRILHDNLAAGRVTRSDLVAKLREANVKNFEDVRAVVLETTGDISVLHGEGRLEDDLLQGVRRTP